MGFLNNLFGNKTNTGLFLNEKIKLELICKLLAQRIRNLGFDELECRKVKELNKMQLLGTPEGTIVTLIENIISLQRQGMLIGQIINSIENQRKTIGSNSIEFSEICNLTTGSIEESGNAIPLYCLYRVNIEYQGIITEEEFGYAFMEATQEIMNY